MNNISIYILTHKKFKIPNNRIYKPLLNGSALLTDDFGYLRDDIGDNISNLNPYYAELTGQYWVWKNSNSKIVGFCHYRRYFAKNIFLNILSGEDIKKILLNYDIILPNISYLGMTHKQDIEKSYKYNHIGPKLEEYDKLRKIIKQNYPEYLIYYDELLDDNKGYGFNMFICKKELADNYFKWLFGILKKVKNEIDFSQYPEGQKRILGYFSERLLNVYVKKHNLKIKEKPLLFSDRKIPLAYVVGYKIPFVPRLFKKFIKMKEKIS